MKSLLIPKYDSYIRFHDLPGDEPALVLLHGLGSASSVDYPSITHIPGLSRFRFILPDLFGFGYSDRPDNFDYSLQAHAETIYEVIHSLGLSGVNLFGHSMGGAIAVALTAAHPELINRLVLAEANLDPGQGQASKMISEQSEYNYINKGHKLFISSIKKGIQESPSFSAYVGALEIADPRAMYKSAVGLMRGTLPPQRELFLSMKIPREFIYGEYSLPDPNMGQLSSGGIKILIVPKAGHAMMHDNPDGFALALLQSFQS